MIISEKLYQLRTRSGLSQEDLAEKMNVSRQSISKWESGNSIPTIDKILELSKIYGVSTDFLLQDEMNEFPNEVVADTYKSEADRKISMEEVTRYLDLIKVSMSKIALGVMLCILSPVTLFVLEGLSAGHRIPLNENMAGAIGVAVLLVLVALAVVLFIGMGMRLKEYEYLEKESFQLEYGVSGVIEKEEKVFAQTFFKGIAIGVTLCIVAVIPLLIVGGGDGSDEMSIYMLGVLLLLVACGVYAIVYVSIQKGAYDKLLQKGDYAVSAKKRNKRLEAFSSAYWCLTTAIYLGISFWKMNWEISWIIWPVAGVLYAAIHSILSAVVMKEE